MALILNDTFHYAIMTVLWALYSNSLSKSQCHCTPMEQHNWSQSRQTVNMSPMSINRDMFEGQDSSLWAEIWRCYQRELKAPVWPHEEQFSTEKTRIAGLGCWYVGKPTNCLKTHIWSLKWYTDMFVPVKIDHDLKWLEYSSALLSHFEYYWICPTQSQQLEPAPHSLS